MSVKCPFPGCQKSYKQKGKWYENHLQKDHPGFNPDQQQSQQNQNQSYQSQNITQNISQNSHQIIQQQQQQPQNSNTYQPQHQYNTRSQESYQNQQKQSQNSIYSNNNSNNQNSQKEILYVCDFPRCTITFNTLQLKKQHMERAHQYKMANNYQSNSSINQDETLILDDKTLLLDETDVYINPNNYSNNNNNNNTSSQSFKQNNQNSQQQNQQMQQPSFVKTATGKDKDLQCVYCDIAYSSKYHLKNHLLKKHPEFVDESNIDQYLTDIQDTAQQNKLNLTQETKVPLKVNQQQKDSQENLNKKPNGNTNFNQMDNSCFDDDIADYDFLVNQMKSQNEQNQQQNQQNIQNGQNNDNKVSKLNQFENSYNPYIDSVNHSSANNNQQQQPYNNPYLENLTYKPQNVDLNQNYKQNNLYQQQQQQQTKQPIQQQQQMQNRHKEEQKQEIFDLSDDDDNDFEKYNPFKFEDGQYDLSNNTNIMDIEETQGKQPDQTITKGLQLDEDVYNCFKAISTLDMYPQSDFQKILAKPSEKFKAKLHDYQLLGFNFMLYRENHPSISHEFANYLTNNQFQGKFDDSFRGGILADSMGLGKTVQTIALMISNYLEQIPANYGQNLLIVPLALLTQWQQEIQKFTAPGSLKVTDYHGPKRKKLNLDQFDVVITTYSTLMSEFKTLQKKSPLHMKHWHRIILDEAHSIKNKQSQQSQACRELKGDNKWILTGTPLQNSLSDFYPYFDFFKIRQYSSWDKFSSDFTQNKSDKTYSIKQYQQLQEILISFTLRRSKQSKTGDGFLILILPSKDEKQVALTMNEQEKEIYDTVFINAQQIVVYHTEKKSKFSCILSVILMLRQLADHFSIINPQYLDNIPEVRDLIIKYENVYPNKFQKIYQIVDKIQEKKNHEKIVIFAQFLPVLNKLKKFLEQSFQGQKALILQGSLNVQERKKVLEDFNNNPDCSILICSLKVGEVGLNLVMANHVVLYDNWYNPTVEEQAIDRVHRIGQDKTVSIYRLYYKETIEERIEEIKKYKLEMIKQQIDTDQNQGLKPKQFTRKDLLHLFKPFF